MFGDQYRQWNTAMDATTAINQNKPLIIVHPTELIQALKELSNKVNVTVETLPQAVEVLAYVFK
ncbi:YtoQ family protein [Ruoffia halotolerans]|uniref:YtoQ family protein n=1 Tax=Ruoffia halotolerans TaxID=2748684 RepID=UPI0022A6B14D|nr:YtoQ family protein [Ruoffia halotolerans]